MVLGYYLCDMDMPNWKCRAGRMVLVVVSLRECLIYSVGSSELMDVRSFQIPLFALWKIYSVFLKPYFFSKSTEAAHEDDSVEQSMSKRQQKLKKRGDKGDPRVKRI
jgi:hypothetical protein